MLVIIGASGKLGFATLNALLDHNLISPQEITCTTSSDSGAAKLKPVQERGVKVVRADWDDEVSLEKAFKGHDKLFLISSSRLEPDFGNVHPENGREMDHFAALEAAKRAGIKHVYYTSLAFAVPSKSRVMKAHERTEDYLQSSSFNFTNIREGVYSESWPLYFGHYDPKKDDRSEIIVAGDSPISWTAIPDLGLANALILAAPSTDWAGKTFYLSQKKAYSLTDIANMLSKPKGRSFKLRVVSREEHEKCYIEERGVPEGLVLWWSTTYDGLRDHECEIDDPTLETLLAGKGQRPKPFEDTLREQLL